jgi:hypothetical protein
MQSNLFPFLARKCCVRLTVRTAYTHWHLPSHALMRFCVHTAIQLSRVKRAPKGNRNTYRKEWHRKQKTSTGRQKVRSKKRKERWKVKKEGNVVGRIGRKWLRTSWPGVEPQSLKVNETDYSHCLSLWTTNYFSIWSTHLNMPYNIASVSAYMHYNYVTSLAKMVYTLVYIYIYIYLFILSSRGKWRRSTRNWRREVEIANGIHIIWKVAELSMLIFS